MQWVPSAVPLVAFVSCSVHSRFSYELNLSVRQSGFTIYRRYKPEWNDDNQLKVICHVPLKSGSLVV